MEMMGSNEECMMSETNVIMLVRIEVSVYASTSCTQLATMAGTTKWEGVLNVISISDS